MGLFVALYFYKLHVPYLIHHSYEEEFPDLEAAAKVKGKKVENKQHAGMSSLNENKTQVYISSYINNTAKFYTIIFSFAIVL